MSPSLAPSLDEDLHLVLCDFGRAGQAYIKTDPHVGDAGTIVRALLTDQYDRPLRVVALNVEEGWSRDVSEIMAAKVRALAEDEERRSDRGDNGLHREAQRAGQTANTAAPMLSAFRDECTNAATWKGQNLSIAVRWPQGPFEQNPGLVAELVSSNWPAPGLDDTCLGNL